MVEFKFVINDVKTGKSYQKVLDSDAFVGKKIGDKIQGSIVGLKNYDLVISGGSDKSGFPMRNDIEITGRKKILSQKSIGIKINEKGKRIRKTVRGSVISDQTAQINLKVEKYGTETIAKLLGIEEKKEEVKEQKPEEPKK
ncbi:30S ribosomal protein S6e [Candidatus Woesearchaeota archaeon]|nr:30S ribosomal protein S6e [Candidatus Woesearchaeota archaeon]